ncbi:5'-nucleotidase, lipoprotein e(P4) family [Bacillus sp. FSL R12-0069]|uniref:5'-nucleotidase, lipoprotein e(P4) family n=1 Tax=Bacillus sp. FSL R12-0069 TaxID=2975342 RepID=UPI0030FB1803
MKPILKTSIALTLFSLSLMGCQSPQTQPKQTSSLTEQQVMADAWYQTAGEVKALYHQGYNIGKMKLGAALAKGTEKKPAIVLDLDETVVDNSPYQAMTVKEKKGKEKRRKKVATEHDIVLFFGDNLSDFTGFDEKSVQDRNQSVEEMHEAFGEKFIMFPNPMYGDWESALYQYDFKKSDVEKDKLSKDALRVFEDGK